MNQKFKKTILLTGDIMILYASLYFTLLIRYLEQPSAENWSRHLGPFSIVFIAWVLIFYISDLYNLHLDHVSQPSREKSMVLLIERIVGRGRAEPGTAGS